MRLDQHIYRASVLGSYMCLRTLHPRHSFYAIRSGNDRFRNYFAFSALDGRRVACRCAACDDVVRIVIR